MSLNVNLDEVVCLTIFSICSEAGEMLLFLEYFGNFEVSSSVCLVQTPRCTRSLLATQKRLLDSCSYCDTPVNFFGLNADFRTRLDGLAFVF